MADTQVLTAQALSMTVYHHRYGQIAGHPAITEHGLYVAGLGKNYPEHVEPVVKPSGVIIKSIDNASPLTAASVTLALKIHFAEVFCTDSLVRHYFTPPLILLISRLSTNACTRVRS